MRILLTTLLLSSTMLQAQNYTSYHTGSMTDAVTTGMERVCLMGGATEDDGAMKWFLQGANGGDVVVLRTSGSDGYNDYMYIDLGVGINSVETFVCHNRQAAYDATLLQQVAQAEAIWFAGGDQWTYVSNWRDTPLDSLINTKLQSHTLAIGGTSAGMAILGQYYFSAENGTVTSADALTTPYDSRVTVDITPFIQVPLLQNIITDTHFDNPDRKGRLITFMARLVKDYGLSPRAIACDEYTAVCIESNGQAHVRGDYPSHNDYAYFVMPNCDISPNTPEQINQSTPLTWSHNMAAIKAIQIPGVQSSVTTINLADWSANSSNAQWYNWYVTNGSFMEAITTQTVCPTGIEEAEAVRQMRLYPSPSRDIMHLVLSSDDVQDFYTLSNPLGQIILQGKIENKQTLIPVAQLMPGMYTLTVLYRDGQVITQRFYVYR